MFINFACRFYHFWEFFGCFACKWRVIAFLGARVCLIHLLARVCVAQKRTVLPERARVHRDANGRGEEHHHHHTTRLQFIYA